MSHSTKSEKKHRYTVLSNAECLVWQKLLENSWAQMQGLFPRLLEFTGPRQRYFVRDVTSRRAPNALQDGPNEHIE